jgi:hypothetical protein
VRAEFLDAITALTEGNLFFIEEVLKSLISAGDIIYADGTWDRKPLQALQIPRSVQAAVQRRLDQLSREARELIAVAAVAGRRFEFALLQRLVERDNGSCYSSLLPIDIHGRICRHYRAALNPASPQQGWKLVTSITTQTEHGQSLPAWAGGI